MIGIVVVDDHRDVREGLVAALAEEPSFRVVASHATAPAALAAVDRDTSSLGRDAPAVVVVDQELPGASSSQLVSRLRRRRPDLRVVVLVTSPRAAPALAALASGAHGVVVKDTRTAILREAVRAVAVGGVFLDPRLAGAVVDRALAAHGRSTRPEATPTVPAGGRP